MPWENIDFASIIVAGALSKHIWIITQCQVNNPSLIGRHRLFYSGRADTFPINRCLGSLTLYAAPEGALAFSIDNGVWHRRDCVAVAPSVPHRIRACSDRILTVFVELRDVNYPGSRYQLLYDPQTDQLSGSDFQAVQRQTFDVVFVRQEGR